MGPSLGRVWASRNCRINNICFGGHLRSTESGLLVSVHHHLCLSRFNSLSSWFHDLLPKLKKNHNNRADSRELVRLVHRIPRNTGGLPHAKSTMSSKLIPPNPDEVMVIRQVTPEITTLSLPFLRFGKIKIGGRGTLGKMQNPRRKLHKAELTLTLTQSASKTAPWPVSRP